MFIRMCDIVKFGVRARRARMPNEPQRTTSGSATAMELAEAASISIETVKRIEVIAGPVSANCKTVDAILRASKRPA
jgi:hypothetical protein